ncbi:hypothetical protein BaRGS_00002060 [Batillaria attramentaria]|uniref:Uncharacterized protein n=1 Tax=Batillaria attramentaria TaxID=370345 RepID=A0ABD0M3U8_9CAEN
MKWHMRGLAKDICIDDILIVQQHRIPRYSSFVNFDADSSVHCFKHALSEACTERTGARGAELSLKAHVVDCSLNTLITMLFPVKRPSLAAGELQPPRPLSL